MPQGALASGPTSVCNNCFWGQGAGVSRPCRCAPDPPRGPQTRRHQLPAPRTLTVLLLQDQDHVRLLQRDLVHLLGQVGPGDLHLEQVWGRGGGRQRQDCPPGEWVG